MGGGFYLLLIDTTSLPELYVLGGVALTCGVAVELAREQRFVEAVVRPGWLAGVWRLAYMIPADIALVSFEALAQLVSPRSARGTFRAASFGADAETPAATGRRALTESLGSMAPNTIVLGVDAQSGLLLVHQLRVQGAPDSLDILRLG